MFACGIVSERRTRVARVARVTETLKAIRIAPDGTAAGLINQVLQPALGELLANNDPLSPRQCAHELSL